MAPFCCCPPNKWGARLSRSPRGTFYQKTIGDWIPDRSSSILVVAGGGTDRAVLSALGFTNVTISNVDTRIKGTEFAPFAWRFEDGSALTVDDESYDYAIIHAGLHHMTSPHKALTEMYRVARKGVAIFEARDSLTMRLLERFGFTQSYEHSAVYEQGSFGGVENTEIPNYIYRWTERELEKTIASYAPAYNHKFRYSYGATALSTPLSLPKRILVAIATPMYRLFSALFPRQGNLFAAFIEKPVRSESLQPWLQQSGSGLTFNREWGVRQYGKFRKFHQNPRA